MSRLPRRMLLVTMALSVLAAATPAPGWAAENGPPETAAAAAAAESPVEARSVLADPADETGYAQRESEARSLEEFRGGWHGVIITVAVIAAIVFLVVFFVDGAHAHYYGCGHEWHGAGHSHG